MYYGVDAQVSVDWLPGITTFRAEYITGVQPSSSASSTSVSAAFANGTYVYSRKFNGAYFYFLQNVMQTKLQLVVKYDWYDPNTDVKGKEVGLNGTQSGKPTNSTDIKYSTLGLGAIWRFDQNLKIMAYYDMVTNEKTSVSGYTNDVKDNVVTVRLQYRF